MTPPTHDSRRARFARARHPGFGWCLRCGMPWASAQSHDTPYGEVEWNDQEMVLTVGTEVIKRVVAPVGHSQTCFPLCEGCWSKLTIEEREPYYWTLIRDWEQWEPVSEKKAHDVIAAVREGR